ncbi:hypothetical protein [Billgrantia endophytica]|uniref:RNA polymerase sigma factor 54 DNA-binding domain-containing protein n=1 Tax=Billgrantia endophytica TaxID=2033802 RepID=A0A2N7U5I1_9GAMM|nr:hypothetical protein [Halomonas endophytica]PMR75698.1 hypothetical protein C1H69_08655 [Halomonas endophytica]
MSTPTTRHLEPALLGKISLARILEMPLSAFRRFVVRVEQSREYQALASQLLPRLLDGAVLANAPPGNVAGSLGVVRSGGDGFELHFLKRHYACEYRFVVGDALEELPLLARQEGHIRALLPKLRLINTRNRLTLALVRLILHEQAAYLGSGDGTLLRPLTQTQCASHLQAQGSLDMVVDTSRISRLARDLPIVLSQGAPVQLASLMPRPRQVYAHLVEHVIRRERQWMAHGTLEKPLTDQAIANHLRRHGVPLLRRTVTDIRHELAIPDYRHRHGGRGYLSATETFSNPVVLNRQALKTFVPTCPGVYEIRVPSHSLTMDAKDTRQKNPLQQETLKNIQPLPISNIVYIGSAGNLRKRLSDHHSGRSGNHVLYRYITKGYARVRYNLVDQNWRQAERDLYQLFCRIFGSPPQCNRMSP